MSTRVKQLTKAAARRAEEVTDARMDGENIRFFLNGGNDVVFKDNDAVVAMVLANVSRVIPSPQYEAIVDAAGFEKVLVLATGGWKIVRKS